MQPSLFHIDPPAKAQSFSRQCRASGRHVGAITAGSLCDRMLRIYRLRGPMTDAEMAAYLGIERSSINARRAELKGQIDAKGTRVNAASGVRNTTWGLV